MRSGKKRYLKLFAMLLLSILICGMMAACKPNDDVTGKIYSLEAAYDNGLLTADDLQNISYYMGCAGNAEFSPTPKDPPTLNNATASKIKQLYLKELQNDYPKATVNDVTINDYFGTYGSCIAVRLSNELIRCDYIFVDEQEIGGVTFYNYCGAFVSIIVF